MSSDEKFVSGHFFLSLGFVEPTEAEDYHALTEREQQDLNKLMSQCGFAISNAEAFMEMIARDLSVLDGVNYHFPLTKSLFSFFFFFSIFCLLNCLTLKIFIGKRSERFGFPRTSGNAYESN